MKTLQEVLIDALRSTRLYEMAYSQNKCEDMIAAQCDNILENLVLLNYFKVSKLDSLNIQHWKEELDTAIYNAGKFRLKDNNSTKRRERLVNRVFIIEDMNIPKEILKRVKKKLRKESETQYPEHPNSKEWLGEAIAALLNQLDDIKHLIVNFDDVQIENWVNTTFK